MLDRVVLWPPNYVRQYGWRAKKLAWLREDPERWICAKAYYHEHPAEFIEHWCDTYDPRYAGSDHSTTFPFILFKRQKEAVEFVYECLEAGGSGLIEKSKDMGVTWLCCAISVHLFLFWDGASIGWGSRVSRLVDQRDNPDSIFQKVRIIIQNLPVEFWPAGFNPVDNMSIMKIVNPENGATITGEGGDDVGRGGRSLLYFVDEAAHLEHPELIEAALSDNAKVRIDFSSVCGLGTVFHRKREAGVDWSPGQPIRRDRINVLVMDWRDHPAKTQIWYDERKAKFTSEGLAHVFAQEVDRNYGAAVQGVIIPPDWVKAAIDAHIHLGFDDDGPWRAALDVADGGLDTNALAKRKGVVLRYLEEWGERDTGVTTRRAIAACRDLGDIEMQYDAVGIGSGVKSESNRLIDDDVMPRNIRLVPWSAGAEVLNPDKHIIPGDKQSPLNKDFYANLKAQAAWQLRLRFERTYRARNEPGFTWDAEDLISIDSSIPLLRKLEKELSQPTMGQSSKMKLLINKAPEGSKSPNLFDSVMMNYWPVPSGPRPMVITDDILARASRPMFRR